MSKYNQSLSKNLQEIKSFLYHIEGRVGEQAHAYISSVTDEAIEQVKDLRKTKKKK